MNDYRHDGLLTAPDQVPQRVEATLRSIRMFAICLSFLPSLMTTGTAFGSDGHALGRIVGETVIGENVEGLYRRLAGRSDEDRFRILSDWVLPGPDHQRYRLRGHFTPLNPAAVSDSEAQSSAADSPSEPDSRGTRMQIGGKLEAPAFELVAVAARLGRLEALHDRLTRHQTNQIDEQRAQFSLQFLIQLERGDRKAATTALTQLFDLFRQSDHVEVNHRWPEMLAVTRGMQKAPSLKPVGELLYLNYEKFVHDLHGWRRHGNDLWDSHLFSLLGRQRDRESSGRTLEIPPSSSPFDQWHPVSRFTARTRGMGLPPTYWHRNTKHVTRISGHAQDYLMFQSPLQGDFDIECDVTSTNWHSMELLVAGRWVGTYWNRNEYRIGFPRSELPRIPLDRPMAKFPEWSRYRVKVRDGLCSVYFNGRRIHEDQIGESFDPWIAVRCEARSLGAVRDVRISGTPEVPESLNLAIDQNLPGWAGYYEEPVGENGHWYWTHDEESFGIAGRRQSDRRGSFEQRLLQYYRPMLEDGTIEYDFYYEPGQSNVHPTLDRLAFLLEPDGVIVHRVTDGINERGQLTPDNRTTEPASSQNTSPLPLKAGSWNHLSLILKGDRVSLKLNGESIVDRVLEPTNQRTFGLFHYADQTEARVRNIIWRGDWPRQIPTLQEQELAVPDHECLDGLDSLTEVFTHSFTDELPDEVLRFSGATSGQTIRTHERGLRVTPPVQSKWTGTRVEYARPVYGDFDATLRFELLTTSYGTDGSNELMLLATDESGITVRSSSSQYADERSYAFSVMTLPLPNNTKRYIKKNIVDETRSGTLRLIRRGAVLHSLIAGDDSTNFRYIGSHELPSSSSAIQFACLTSQNNRGLADAVLRNLTIRSNTTEFESRIDARVNSLNQYTSRLPTAHRHGFAASGTEGFSIVGDAVTALTDGGLLIDTGGDAVNAGTALISNRRLEQDFDLNITLNASGLTVADSGGRVSVSVNSQRDRATLSLKRLGKNQFNVTASVQRTGDESQPAIVAVENATSVDSLRIVRIQKTILFVYSAGGLARLLGQADFESTPVAEGGVRLEASRQSGQVLWKSFETRTSAPVRSRSAAQ